MSAARDQILGRIRASLGDTAPGRDESAVDSRLASPRPGVIPARAALDRQGQVELFIAMAEEVSATVARVATPGEAAGAVADYLAERNLPARAALAPDPALDDIAWHERPLLELRRGKAEETDPAAITGAFAAIAETGTLMLLSGPEHPSTLNFLPDTHIVVVRRDQVVGTYEDAWERLRARGRGMPRTVNMVTGPSRTADIEQTIHLGAHGPRRLHIVLIDGADDGGEAES